MKHTTIRGSGFDKGGFATIIIDGVEYQPTRVSACVNALAGVKDPEAFMRDVRDLLHQGVNWGTYDILVETRKHLKGGE